VVFGLKILFDMTKIRFFGKKDKSQNIMTEFRANKPETKRPVVIFSAHYDSVSLRFSMTTVKILYGTGALYILTYLILTLILSIWSLLALFSLVSIGYYFIFLTIITLVIGDIILIMLVFIFFNKKTNNSTGSIDNATGVSVLLELAKLIKKYPLENIDVWFLWCGAEEWGLYGSKNFCKVHFNDLNEEYELDKSYNINIDMVGSYIGLVEKTGLIKKKRMNEKLNDILVAEAKNLNIPLAQSSVPIGSGSDHMVFQGFAKKNEKKKFQVCCFLSIKDSKYIHSARDKAELCSAEKLNGCIDICYNALKSIDLRVE
jgi:hypothetical protein